MKQASRGLNGRGAAVRLSQLLTDCLMSILKDWEGVSWTGIQPGWMG